MSLLPIADVDYVPAGVDSNAGLRIATYKKPLTPYQLRIIMINPFDQIEGDKRSYKYICRYFRIMRGSVIVILLFFSQAPVFARQIDIQPFINAWKTDDRSQTRRSAPFYDSLDLEKDTLKYHQTLKALYDYLSEHPDKRIKARILMYEVLGAMVFQYHDDKYRILLEEAMRLANDLRDDQLMAEIYALYAEVAGQNNHLLYNLKAIEIQRKIGFEYFTTVHNRFFIVSNALYHSREYRQSIQYGLECLSFIGIDKEHWLKKVYILQLDILGASYKRLGICDSTRFYYQKILDTLQSDPDTGYTQKLWTGIAKGNIGHCLALSNNLEKAIPMMQEYVRSSLEVGDAANVAIAQNLLASIYYARGQYSSAMEAWQAAYHYADKKNPTDILLETAKGIAAIYRHLGRTDSAFYYYDRYHAFADTLENRLAESTLSAMNARIAFDNMQKNLDDSRNALRGFRTTLQLVIAGAILLIVIFLLLYNRYRLKNKHRFEIIRRKKELAEQEIANAKKQINAFRDHIIEKDNIIHSMQKELDITQASQENQENYERLSKYMLVSDEEWKNFRSDFTKAYPSYFNILRQRLPQITPAEERLSALIFLGINNYQMAKMLGIARESVFRARRRLRQRLALDESELLDEFLVNIIKHNV